MALVEEGDNIVAGLEAVHVLSYGDDGSSTVRTGDDTLLHLEGIRTLGNNEITVLRASSMSVFSVFSFRRVEVGAGLRSERRRGL